MRIHIERGTIDSANRRLAIALVMELEKVIPFGYPMDEYKKMFALSEEDLDKRIVGVADGPASFNADIFALRIMPVVVSVDPLYAFGAKEFEK